MTMYATQKLHYSIVEAGMIMALFGAGSIVGAFIGGKLTDAIGFYKIQLFALSGGGLMFIVLGYLQSYVLLCCGTFVLSLINESFRPAHSTAIAFYSKPENRTRSYSLNRLAINLGWAFGGALGGFLASYNYHLLFWVDGLTNIAAAVMLSIVLPVPPGLQSTLAKNKTKASDGISAYRDKQYLFFIFLTILFAFCFFQMFTILPVFLKQKLALNERLIGVLMAINGLIIAAIEMVVVFKLEAKAQPLKFIKFGVWMVGLSYEVFNFLTGEFALALFSMVIITFGEMLSMPFMNSYWISRSQDHNRGQYAALYTMAWGTAQIAAPSVGGFIAARYSFNTLWWIVFVITLAAGVGYHQLALLCAPIKKLGE
ncbi:MFS transporter [Segetibacter aerophilus]|uniref:MFS transporter n=2 Tax=Segetibacter aerophilus TaxID=670293 RepID=A0A512B723_9BACT|nr:MFS transporter [Segetibacter aerophilus]